MKKIGIISDTHAYWDEKYLHYFEPCDEIWHAGDIGSVEVAALNARMSTCSSSISAAIQATTTTLCADSCMPIRRSSLWLGIHIY